MISPKTISAIRERVEIVSIISETVKLTRKGRSYTGLCPFHREKTPSFNVNPEKGFFYCFGCKEKGTAFDFLMKAEGLTFPEAARRLADRAGIEIEETATDTERREADAARRAIDDLYAATQLAAHWFERQMREHPTAHLAWDELRRRGLAPSTEAGANATGPVAEETLDASARDALQAFRVGYAPDSWDGLTQFFAQQGVSPVVATKVGLIAPRKNSAGHYDWFRHRLMFAILDVRGRVVGFSGRVLPDPETGTVDKQSPKYINSPESPIYQKGQTLFGLYQARQAIRQEEEAILVEGNFDVVSLHARGVGNVVAPLGTAFTPAQAKLLRRYAPVVTLLFDGDAAGRKATRDARETCRDGTLVAKVGVLPHAKDPDDFVRERGVEALRSTVRAAQGILRHLIDEALDERFRHVDAHEQAARVREVIALINSEEDPTVRRMTETYADLIAQRLGTGSFGLLKATVARTLDSSGAQGPGRSERTPPGGRNAQPVPGQTRPGPYAPGAQLGSENRAAASRGGSSSGGATPRSPAELAPWRVRSLADPVSVDLEILGCFLDFPELLLDPVGEQATRDLSGPPALAAAALLQAQKSGQQISQDVLEILAQVPDALHTFAAERLASPLHEHCEIARAALVQNAEKLKRREFLRRKAQVVEALHRIERTGETAAEDALLREINRRAREKHGLKEG
ncbi:MAG TPA: DNA primase [Polyangiaceae bacterium]|nr:DNA primase [Polyangiaceae bacterium]